MKNLRIKPFIWCLFVIFAISALAIALWHGKSVSDLWSAIKIGYAAIPAVFAILVFFLLMHGAGDCLVAGWSLFLILTVHGRVKFKPRGRILLRVLRLGLSRSL